MKQKRRKMTKPRAKAAQTPTPAPVPFDKPMKARRIEFKKIGRKILAYIWH